MTKLTDQEKQRALTAFREKYTHWANTSDEDIQKLCPYIEQWLGAWQLATQAAYGRAADMCKQQGDETLCSWCTDTSKLEDKFRAISKGEPT